MTIIVVLFLFLITNSPANAQSCTYKSTINDNHIDVQITKTDWDNLGILEIVNTDHVVTWGQTTQPDTVKWYTSWDSLLHDVFFALIGGNNADRVYWGFNQYTQSKTIPYGVYGVDFSGLLNYQNIIIQVNHPEDVGDNYIVCNRTGEIVTYNPPTKLILVPGLGASWNAEALLNCSDSNTPWVLAPYAEDVYNPAINAIKANGWDALPFYYDWRKNVDTNSKQLAVFVDKNTAYNEKINLAGHSMGGLVERGYLNYSGGKKIANLLTIGTPNKGSALAYPPWAWGQVWSNNFIEKIALTLYLEHCGGLFSDPSKVIREKFPSIRDLLPTYPYFRIIPSTELTTPIINIWLNNLNNIDKSYGVRLGYIAGTGFDTLKTIQVKIPSKGDLKKNIWTTEKPVGNVSSTFGDGTVLLESAILPGATYSAVINENHRGLVSSTQGIAKILEFFGRPNQSPTVQYTNNESPNSALILIGYPASFSVFDENGNVKNDEQGMVAITNPKSGNYKLNLISKSPNTTFIVAQFLPSGEVKYKEYKFKGIGPKYKNLKFDLINPQEDVLTD